MTEIIGTPTRNQLAKVANGDLRLLIALEQLFDASSQVSAGTINALEVRVSANEERIKTNEVLLWLSM